ncbi:hypothetical protein BBW65_01000 [Helicobacter enhydrae]|uniref:Uncharacterized protein n=1 Tax=Helicobacter enhydrae TaxID=222136 RepID=A0A1B1U3X5_9HELI|nr:hypothetical protein [Helicobacter enhydrae]ANV97477.1 hypothetical protein BBW65_01000 [Helicobacter enhydrae]
MLLQNHSQEREVANSVLQNRTFGNSRILLGSTRLVWLAVVCAYIEIVRVFEVLVLYNHICVGEGRFLVKGGGKYGFSIPTYKASASFGRASKSYS